MHSMRHSLARLLSQLLGEQEWNVQKAMDGMQKEAYIAHSRTQKVFLKFDVPPSLLPALERLGEIGVSPPLLAAGTHRRRNYIVQSYLEGVYPDKMWFRTHLPELARFVRAYHRDEELARRLSFGASPYRQHVQQRIRDLDNQLQQAGNETFRSAEVLAALRRFR